MCKRHDPIEVFPRRSDLPESATKEQQIALFLKMFRQPTDMVVCRECGKVGHWVKSRRGGVRWHDGVSEYAQKAFALAAECWADVGKSPPFPV